MKKIFKLLALSIFLSSIFLNANSNEVVNNLKTKFTDFFNQSLNEMFPYS